MSDVGSDETRVPTSALAWASPEARRDAALVAQVLRGSEAAAAELVRRHWDRTHRAAYLITRDAAAADDVCQEAFMAALGALDRFDRRRPLRPWLHRIAANRAVSWVRARERRVELEGRAGEDEAVGVNTDPAWAASLDIGLAGLEPQDRAIVVLRHVLDYSSREIGRMLGLPAATVRTRLRRSLERLRAVLDEEEGL